ncbi:hypothetical protein [Nostoc foliaceum]|nr:hypothetical protein [Nostoc foliaceum]
MPTELSQSELPDDGGFLAHPPHHLLLHAISIPVERVDLLN